MQWTSWCLYSLVWTSCSTRPLQSPPPPAKESCLRRMRGLWIQESIWHFGFPPPPLGPTPHLIQPTLNPTKTCQVDSVKSGQENIYHKIVQIVEMLINTCNQSSNRTIFQLLKLFSFISSSGFKQVALGSFSHIQEKKRWRLGKENSCHTVWTWLHWDASQTDSAAASQRV